MMLPVSLSELFVVVIIAIFLLGKKEIAEVISFMKEIFKKINDAKNECDALCHKILLKDEIDQLKTNITSKIIGIDGKEYECYLPSVFQNDINLVEEIKNFEIEELKKQQPTILERSNAMSDEKNEQTTKTEHN